MNHWLFYQHAGSGPRQSYGKYLRNVVFPSSLAFVGLVFGHLFFVVVIFPIIP
jgi:hypothetical protein